MKPPKERRADFPPREAWDFSTCSPEELRDCYCYELTREIQRVRDSVREWRKNHRGYAFDDWLPIASEHSRIGRPGVFGWELFNFCPEWPEKPYLSIPEPERQRRRRLMPRIIRPSDSLNALRIVALPRLLKSYQQPAPLGGQWVLPPENKLTVKSPDGFHETVVFDVDWRHSDRTIMAYFRRWLKSRPPNVKQWQIKGKGRAAEQMKKELKALGAWRLLQEMTWSQAADYTSSASKSGKPLYAEQSAWIRAEQDAKAALAKFAG